MTGFGSIAGINTTENKTSSSTSLFGTTGSTSFTFGFATTASSPSCSANLSTNHSASAIVTLPEHVELKTGEEDELNLHEVRCKSFKWVLEEAKDNSEDDKDPSQASAANPSVKPSSNFQNVKKDQDKTEKSSSSPTVPTDGTATFAGDKDNHRWQELGVGPLKVLQSRDFANKIRLVQRRESTPNGSAHKVILNVPLWKEATCKKTSEKNLTLITVGSSGEGETYAFKFKEIIHAAAFFTHLQEIIHEAKSCFS
jgi:hypothetical protein